MNDKLYNKLLREAQKRGKHLLLEGGVAGHLAHLYDNPDLSYSDMEEILSTAARGELIGTEKTDGYNIYLSYVDGEARYARNKGDMRKGGSNTADLAARVFKGGEGVKRVYTASFRAFEKAVRSLTPEEQQMLFGSEAPIFLNTEIQGPGASNVVNYDANVLSIHSSGHKQYIEESDTVVNVKDSDVERVSQALDDVLDRFEEATADEPFSVRKTATLQLQALSDRSILEDTLRRMNHAGFSGNMTIGQYTDMKLTPIIKRAVPSANKEVIGHIIDHFKAVKGRVNIRKVRKMLRDEQEVAALSQLLEKNNKKRLLGEIIEPIEDAIHDFAVEMLKGLESAYILDNGNELGRLRDEVATAIDKIQTYDGPGKDEAHEILIRQLKKLKSHDNVNTAVEGFVFTWNGQMYKFTGNFAPINQILGLFRYGRGDVEAIDRLDEATARRRIVAIVPGAFKLPHRGHFAMVRQYAVMADEVKVYVSPLSRKSDGEFAEPIDFTSEHSMNLWNKYVEAYGLTDTVKVSISSVNSPVRMTYDFVGNEDNDPQKAQPGDHVILGVSTKGGDHSRFAGSVQQYARDGVRVLAGEQYAVNVDGKDFTRQVVEVDPETGEEKVTTVDLSATDFRNAVEEGDVQTVAEFLPQAIRGQAKEVINMMGAQVAMSDPEQAQIAETLMRLIEETMDEISAMAGGAVEGPASKKKKKEADTLIREDDEEIEENMADLAWGPAALSLDPVERAPYYEEGDEIETMAKKRSGANVALGE
ncbi:MAG: hypothetical protein HOJ16_02910 [Candidatus Peribacter sp.]|jgi:hypothetical protein|nr:hypothetical protein [Candidatus Peribacter sp.]